MNEGRFRARAAVESFSAAGALADCIVVHPELHCDGRGFSSYSPVWWSF
jgi:hypothetical protein